MLKEMMKQLGGGGGEGEDFEGILQTMMSQLMSKDILYEPLQDLAKKYPPWLKENREKIETEEYKKYEQQYRYCLEIIRVFDGTGDALQVTELMQKMQECGAPPAEILEDLAPELQLGSDGIPKMPDASDCNQM